jgi:hypothetical protein
MFVFLTLSLALLYCFLFPFNYFIQILLISASFPRALPSMSGYHSSLVRFSSIESILLRGLILLFFMFVSFFSFCFQFLLFSSHSSVPKSSSDCNVSLTYTITLSPLTFFPKAFHQRIRSRMLSLCCVSDYRAFIVSPFSFHTFLQSEGINLFVLASSRGFSSQTC